MRVWSVVWRVVLTVAALILPHSAVRADDWPQWLGPQRDGVLREAGLSETFPQAGLTVRWRAPVGAGYAGPAVAGGRVYVTDRMPSPDAPKPKNAFDRAKLPGVERVLCIDDATGRIIWKHEYACDYTVSYGAGPRATPTVDGDRVYTLGAEGHLFCLAATDGKVLWSKRLSGENAPTPTWGFAGHPLVDGDRLVCLTANADATVTAFDKLSGDVVWKALPAREPGYAPPVIYEIAGERQLVLWNVSSINGLDPKTGAVRWSHPFGPARFGGIIVTPQHYRDPQLGDLLFVSAQYEGSMMLKIAKGEPRASLLWHKTGKQTLRAVIPTPVIRGGHVYGVDYQGALMCLNAATGEKRWETTDATSYSDEPVQWATGFITPLGETGDRHLIANEHGDLILCTLKPEGYTQISRAHVLDPTNEDARRPVVWSHPAYANQNIYWRNDKELVCASLAAPQK